MRVLHCSRNQTTRTSPAENIDEEASARRKEGRVRAGDRQGQFLLVHVRRNPPDSGKAVAQRARDRMVGKQPLQ